MYRARRQVVSLDAALDLTEGNPAGRGLLRRQLRLDEENQTLVALNNPRLIGQVRLPPGGPAAHLTFLLPAEALDSTAMAALLDALAEAAGLRGSLRLLADVDEQSPAFEVLRHAGYTLYAWQRVFSFHGLRERSAGSAWRALGEADIPAVRGLYQSLVPPLAQAAEAFNPQPGRGLVYRQGSDLLAFAGVSLGAEGVYLVPLIHPGVERAGLLLSDLLQQPKFGSRPRHLALRSYMAWLESSVGELECQAAPRQALLVKYLAALLRQALPSAQAVLEPNWTRPVHTIEQQ